MPTKKTNRKTDWARIYCNISNKITHATGSPIASLSSFALIIVWAMLGPVFNFSDTWQLVINTGTTIITFLMVFVIQQSQNKDTTAIQLKLNELIASNATSSNRLISIEDLTEQELEVIKKFYTRLAALAGSENDVFATHSIDEAEDMHEQKRSGRSKKAAPVKKATT